MSRDGQDWRNPPLKYAEAKRGLCRLCGKRIYRKDGSFNRDKKWHRRCYTAWGIASRPEAARRALWKRDKGHCNVCGEFDERWEADHMRPLFTANGDFDFWRITNLQTICKPCHTIKSVKEQKDARTKHSRQDSQSTR